MVKRHLEWSGSFLSFLGTFLVRRFRAWSRPCPDTFLLAIISNKASRISFKSLLESASHQTKAVCTFTTQKSIANWFRLSQSSVMLLWMLICSAALAYRERGPLLCHNFSGLLQWESHRHTGTGLQLPEQSPHCPQPWCCTVCWFPPSGWWQLPLKHKNIINTNIYKWKATNTENYRTAPGIICL